MSYTINKVESCRLDFLRGLAAQFVLIEHILTMNGFHGVFIGSFGVVVFFILSGFLIHITTMKSYDNGHFSMHYYVSKRFFRIFTLYFPLVVLCFLIDNLAQDYGLMQPEKVVENSTVQNFVSSFFMLQQNVFSEVLSQLFGINELRLKPYGSARPFWTVAIEWWIYIAYGFLFSYFVAKEKLPTFFSFKGVFFAFSILTVVFNMVSGIGHNLSIIWMVGLFIGHYYYRGSFSHIPLKNKFVHVFMLLLLVLFLARVMHMYLSPMYAVPIPYDLVNVVIFAIFFILFLSTKKTFIERGRVARFFRYVGEISYALYLIHFTVLSVLYGLGLFESFGVGEFLLAFVISNLAAITLYIVIDKQHSWLWRKYWSLRGENDRGQ